MVAQSPPYCGEAQVRHDARMLAIAFHGGAGRWIEVERDDAVEGVCFAV